MRTGVFGGYFNPPHNGHVKLLRQVTTEFMLDNVIVVPTGNPPHKTPELAVSSDNRLEMCKLAFSDDNTSVSDIELKRSGKSYTFDTLTELKAQTDDELFLIIGADMLMIFDKWYRYRDIFSLAGVIAACRTNSPAQLEALKAKAYELGRDGGKIYLCDLPPFEISSTEIRVALKKGESISHFVPPAVEQYIINGGYYYG